MPRSGVIPLVLLLGCGSSIPSGGPYTTATPPPATSAAATPGPAPQNGEADPLAAIRSRGEAIHGEPIRIASAQGRAERFLVFLGSAEVARAAWIVTPGAKTRAAVPVSDWPEGVKVVGATMRGHMVYVLVETLATLDQPAGFRSVWTIDADYATAGDADDDFRFVGVKELDDVKKRLNMPPPTLNLKHEDMIDALKTAAQSLGAIGKAFPESGADFYQIWQGALFKQLEHVDAKTLPKSQRAKQILALVRAASAQERCEGQICWADGEKGENLGGVALARDGGSVVIAGFVQQATPPAAPAAGAPAEVAAAGSSAETEKWLREQIADEPPNVPQMMGEAPLTKSGGTIGVAESTAEDHHLLVVVHDGNFTRVYHDKSVVQGSLRPEKTVKFADIDGDGRTDVIVRSSGHWEQGQQQVTYTRALLAPRSVQTTTLQGDFPAELAMLGTPDMDAAAKAALSVPPRAVAKADACRLLARANTVTGFQAVATQDAKVVTFDQPGWPFLHGTVKSVNTLRADDVRSAGTHCRFMECDPSRPVCTYTEPGTYSEFYLFAFPNGAPRVAGAAFYNGQ